VASWISSACRYPTPNLMALVPIKLRPGISTQPTPLLNESGWSKSQNIRWKDGLPEKGGGYDQFTQVLSGAGVPLALQAWTSLADISILAIACSNRLDVFIGEAVYDITPITNPVIVPLSLTTTTGSATVTINNLGTPGVGFWLEVHAPVSAGGIVLFGAYQVSAVSGLNVSIIAPIQATSSVTAGGVVRQFTTVAGSAIVSVALPAHGLFTGQVASVPQAVSVGGLTLQGNYLANVIDANHYEITASQPATSSATVAENANDISVVFINPPFGSQGNLYSSAATMANWGEFLMFCPQGGPVFVWMPAMGPSTLAAPIATAPQSNNTIIVATQEEQLFCLGSVNAATGLFDPMLINWSDVADYTDFIPTVTNQAGDFRLVTGSRIVGGLALAGGNIIWTDLCAYWAQYLGSPLVWGFQPIGLNFGLVGPHAFGTLGANVFWMTQRQFVFVSPGASPQIMACAVWDLVFKNMDLANLSNVVCETNSFYNEVSWEVPQADGTVTRATIQIDAGLWSYTVLPNNSDDVPRRAWIDQSVFGAPLAADAIGVIWQHETGKNAGTMPLAWSITSGIIMIAEGDQITFFREVKPDFKFGENGPGPGVVQCKIYVYQNPQDPPTVKGPFYITDATRSIPGARGRGRGIQFEFSGNDLDSWIRGGLVEYRGSADGRR
jgi:hypothetical protein